MKKKWKLFCLAYIITIALVGMIQHYMDIHFSVAVCTWVVSGVVVVMLLQFNIIKLKLEEDGQ